MLDHRSRAQGEGRRGREGGTDRAPHARPARIRVQHVVPRGQHGRARRAGRRAGRSRALPGARCPEPRRVRAVVVWEYAGASLIGGSEVRSGEQRERGGQIEGGRKVARSGDRRSICICNLYEDIFNVPLGGLLQGQARPYTLALEPRFRRIVFWHANGKGEVENQRNVEERLKESESAMKVYGILPPI